MGERRGLGSFRHHLILTSALSSGVFAALVAASIFLPLATALDHAEPGSAFSAAIAEHFLDLHRTFWPVVVGALIASVASGLLLYQRMAGPLVRFREVYRQIAAGRLPNEDITLRRFDYLTEESRALNELVAVLREQATDREARATRCERMIDELEALDGGLGEDARSLLGELRAAVKDLR